VAQPAKATVVWDMVMGDVVKLGCVTRLPIPPDDVLEAAVGKLRYVLVLGFGKDGEMYTASSDGDMSEALWITTKFVHKLHEGNYS
jgi:hypothetical protein